MPSPTSTVGILLLLVVTTNCTLVARLTPLKDSNGNPTGDFHTAVAPDLMAKLKLDLDDGYHVTAADIVEISNGFFLERSILSGTFSLPRAAGG